MPASNSSSSSTPRSARSRSSRASCQAFQISHLPFAVSWSGCRPASCVSASSCRTCAPTAASHVMPKLLQVGLWACCLQQPFHAVDDAGNRKPAPDEVDCLVSLRPGSLLRRSPHEQTAGAASESALHLQLQWQLVRTCQFSGPRLLTAGNQPTDLFHTATQALHELSTCSQVETTQTAGLSSRHPWRREMHILWCSSVLPFRICGVRESTVRTQRSPRDQHRES